MDNSLLVWLRDPATLKFIKLIKEEESLLIEELIAEPKELIAGQIQGIRTVLDMITDIDKEFKIV